jgi:hypothetical protein
VGLGQESEDMCKNNHATDDGTQGRVRFQETEWRNCTAGEHQRKVCQELNLSQEQRNALKGIFF